MRRFVRANNVPVLVRRAGCVDDRAFEQLLLEARQDIVNWNKTAHRGAASTAPFAVSARLATIGPAPVCRRLLRLADTSLESPELTLLCDIKPRPRLFLAGGGRRRMKR